MTMPASDAADTGQAEAEAALRSLAFSLYLALNALDSIQGLIECGSYAEIVRDGLISNRLELGALTPHLTTLRQFITASDAVEHRITPQQKLNS